MGGEDDTSSRPGPVLRIESGVVLGQIGVVAVSKNGLDKVEVGNHGSGRDEANLFGV